MKKTTYIIVAVIVLALLVVIFGKTNDKPVIKIGVVGPMTGDFGFYGQMMLSGVTDAVGSSTKYQIVAEDDNCEPAKAVSAIQKLIEIDHVKYIIGPLCGSPQEAIVPIVKNKDVVLILPSAASRSLFADSNKKIFNTQYSLQDDARTVALKMNELGYKTVGLVSYNNAFSMVYRDTFKSEFKGQVFEMNYVDFKSNIMTEITKMKDKKLDAVFVTDLSFFFNGGVERLKQNGINVPVFGQYSVELPPVIPLVQNVIYSYSKDIVGDKGATYELSKLSFENIDKIIKKCSLDMGCAKEKLIDSKNYDEYGIRIQDIIFKQIREGKSFIY